MQDTLKLNAKELGFDATLDSLKQLLVTQFQLETNVESINADDPLFSVGVGLSSLEGLELLALLEKTYGVHFRDLEYWVDESPTLDGVARYLIENSADQ